MTAGTPKPFDPTPFAERAQASAAEAAKSQRDASDEVGRLKTYLAAEGVSDTQVTAITATVQPSVDAITQFATDASTAATACATTTTEADAKPAEAKASEAATNADNELKTLRSNIALARRVPGVAALDRAAAILITAFTVITAALTATGLATGDFTPFFRNQTFWAIAYLVLAIGAILIGTFAFLIDGVRTQDNLRWERGAIYVGVAAFGAAFIIAAVGLAAGSSGGSDRPVLSADVTTSTADKTTSITATASRSAVPRSNVLQAAVWGVDSSGFHQLRYEVVGPAADGTVTASPTATVPLGAYATIIVTAVVGSPPTMPPSAPPGNCQAATSGAQTPAPDLNYSCAILTP